MQITQVRVGQALIAAGLLIFTAQVALLLGNSQVSERRAEVLRGDVEYAGGARDVRPVLSVLGVFCLTAGLFTLALSGGKNQGAARKPDLPA